MDWSSRKVLSWRLSNTIALEEDALSSYGRAEIFNTDQGSQFTSESFTGALKEADIRISMDGKGRWTDNVMIERLWRSLKYEVFTCTLLSQVAKCGRVSNTGSIITIQNVLIQVLTTRLLMRHIGNYLTLATPGID